MSGAELGIPVEIENMSPAINEVDPSQGLFMRTRDFLSNPMGRLATVGTVMTLAAGGLADRLLTTASAQGRVGAVPNGLSVREHAGHGPKLDVVLNGPLTGDQLNTQYTYTVDVTSPTAYKGATINFFSPPPDGRQIRHFNLKPHKPWEGTFHASFWSVQAMTQPGISISVFSHLTKRGFLPLFGKRYAATPATGAGTSSGTTGSSH